MNRRVAAVVAATVLLHLALAWPMPWEGLGLATLLRPSVDFCAILAFALALGSIARLRPAATRLAAALVLLAIGARAAVTVMPAFHNVHFRGDDLLRVPALWYLFTHDRPAMDVAVHVIALICALLCAWLLLLWSCRRLFGAVDAGGQSRRWSLALVLGAIALAAHEGPIDVIQPSSLHRFARACWWSLTDPDRPVEQPGLRTQVARAQQALDAAGPPIALAGADVHLLFVESYGRQAWRDPQTGASLRRLWGAAGKRLQKAGWHAASGWWAPSVQGGGSQLAHMEALTGVRVANEQQFMAVLGIEQRPLPERLRAVGYHTVDAQPGMPIAWPIGRKFYGFDEAVIQPRFQYAGWKYPWGVMPDQFALHWLLEHVVRDAKQPLFLQYVSVSSHAPFAAVPPYEADWSKVDNARFTAEPSETFDLTFVNLVGNPLTQKAYGATLAYSLRVMIDYVLQLERPSLVLVLGDHQPPGAGTAGHPDPSPDVPLHALGNRERLVELLLAEGLTTGVVPPADGAAQPMAEFGAVFLRAFAR